PMILRLKDVRQAARDWKTYSSDAPRRVPTGCFARAQENTGATVHAVAVLSNHFHLLASFESVQQMASFACHVKTNLSKEVGKLHDWSGSLFAGRYRSVPLSDEPEIQEQRLKYVLSQGVKEGLVLSPEDWPGLHCAEALVHEEPLAGVWVNRTALYAARQRDEDVQEAAFAEPTELHLTPLPSLLDHPKADRCALVEGLIASIEAEALENHRKNHTVPLGVEAILARDPHDEPRRFSKSPQPYFHASKQVFKQLMEGFREFTAAYRRAAQRLADGDRAVQFPDNCYPPRLPFVEATVF
ncbi:MAG: hypothetical protein AAGM22_29470, partial [Acidobacteriota bacterium]